MRMHLQTMSLDLERSDLTLTAEKPVHLLSVSMWATGNGHNGLIHQSQGHQSANRIFLCWMKPCIQQDCDW
jgi:hypothetical protein